MSLALIQTNQVLVHQGIISIYGVSPGKFYQDQYVQFAETNGIEAAMNFLAASLTNAQLAQNMATNFGLPDDTLLKAWFTSLIETFGKGGAIQQFLEVLPLVDSTNEYYSAITDFNAKTVASIQHSEVAGSDISTSVISSASTTSGQTFTLTTNADVVTGSSGNDQISGVSGSIDGDVISAGEGTDTASITVTNANDDNASFSATGLETLQIRGTGGAAVVNLDLGDVLGLTTLEFRRMAEDVTVTNVADLDTTLKISDTASATSAVIVNYDAAQVSGSADTANLTVDSTTAGDDFTVNGVETLAVTAVGSDNDIDLDGDDLETVTVAGAGDISIDVDASVTTFNASSNTGGATMVATAAANVTATGGTGDDTFTMGTTLTADDTIDGGDGTDTVGVTGAGGAVMPASAAITNVETLSITTGGADTLDANIVAFDTIITTIALNAETIAMTDVNSESITVRNGTATANTDDDIADINIALEDATGAADSLSVTLENRDVDNEMLITTMDFGTSDIETLTLNFRRAADIADVAEIHIDDINSSHTTLNLTGTADLTIDAKDSAATIVSTVDGDVDLTVGAVDSDITMGAGDDTVAFAGNLDSDDTLDAGDGDDTITASLAAGTAQATISNTETATLDFGTAGATFSALNVDGMTTIETAAASAEAVSLVSLDASVANVRIGSTAAGAEGDAATIRYASGTNSAHTLSIGDSSTTAAADVDAGVVTVSGNEGALTVSSDAFTGNSIHALAANTATGLTITTTENLEADAAGAGDGGIDATEALTVSYVTAGGNLVVDGAADYSKATSISYNGADGNITQTLAVTATAMTSFEVTAAAGQTVTQTGAVTSDADVSTVNMTATGASADVSHDGLLDVDHVETINLTATDGGNIDLGDIELLGVDSDGDDLSTSLNISATGADSSDNDATVTVAAINTATATLDSVSVTTDAGGTASLTTGAANLTITAVDATASEGTFTFGGTTLAAATTISTGSGTNTIRTEADAQDTIVLADSAGTDTIQIYEAQGAGDYDQVSNFEAGADGDVLELDVSALAPGGVALASEGGVTLGDTLRTSFFTDADGAAVDSDPDGNDFNVLKVTDTYANSTTLLAALAFGDGADDVADNEDMLVLWTDGASTYLSVATGDGAAWADFDAINDLVELVGVSVTDIHADNIEFV